MLDKISSYVDSEFPDLFKEKEITVKAIIAERTFWEKITILHHEANRPETSLMPLRYSRHYYDVYKMKNSVIKEKALRDIALLEKVVDFKKKIYPRAWANYDLAKTSKIIIVTPAYRLNELKEDYLKMKPMIFGDYPEFSDIMKELSFLEAEIRDVINGFKH